MMRDANVGNPKDQWKPPEGYKSAIAKVRDAAKAAAKAKAKPKAKPATKPKLRGLSRFIKHQRGRGCRK